LPAAAATALSASTTPIAKVAASSGNAATASTTGAGAFRISLAVLALFPVRRLALEDVAATTVPSSSSSSRSSCLLLEL